MSGSTIRLLCVVFSAAGLLWASPAAADAPPLPPGLDEGEPKPASDAPPLPPGLGGDEKKPPASDAPPLPGGLDTGEGPKLPPGLEAPGADKPKPQTKPQPKDLKWLGLTGFWEIRGGLRTQHDPHERAASLGETRLQLDWEKTLGQFTFKFVGDLVYDPVVGHHTVDIEDGAGLFDLRQANVLFTPLKFMDVKIGRQILTWGTGDLLFINDLFPKDWQAFFIGRDMEYLKAPSDALKMSLFADLANLDVVLTPRFDADRFITGRRLSYYSGMLGRRAGRDAVVRAHLPDEWFDDAEWAARLTRKIGGVELAAYGYWGYWKSPGGVNPATGKAIFPRLSVYGASARGQVGKGIANFEAGYYHSRQDDDGDNPFVNNSQLRMLAGYERDMPEIARDLTLGGQYYVELMAGRGAYARALPPGSHAQDQCRHVLTFRITKKLMSQNLTLSLFAYYSPSDCDAYLRPNVQYKIDDHWTAEAGANVFVGSHRHTFFAQFANNTNVYCALRYGF